MAYISQVALDHPDMQSHLQVRKAAGRKLDEAFKSGDKKATKQAEKEYDKANKVVFKEAESLMKKLQPKTEKDKAARLEAFRKADITYKTAVKAAP